MAALGIASSCEALLFDFDGVLVESVDIKRRAFRTLFESQNKHLPEIEALDERLGGISRLIKIEMVYQEILKQPASKRKIHALAGRYGALVVDGVIKCPAVAGLERIVGEFYSIVPLGVISGTPSEELDHILRERGLSRFFAAIHGSPPGKAETLLNLLSTHGWTRENVVYVGDAWSDFEAAAQTGINFIGRVPHGKASPFPQETSLIGDLTELPAAIEAVLGGR